MISDKVGTKKNIFYAIFLGYIIFLLGSRYEIGPDWEVYTWIFDASCDAYSTNLQTADLVYSGLNCIALKLSFDMLFVNLVCAIVFVICNTYFARLCYDRSSFYIVALPYYIYVVGIGYTRQSVAIALFSLSIYVLTESRLKLSLALQALGFGFHKSIALYALFPILKRVSILFNILVLMPILFLFIVLAFPFYFEYLNQNYINGDFSSEGSLVRVIFCVICSFLYYVSIKKRLSLPLQNVLSVYLPLPFLYLAILLFKPEMSTPIDRLALYQLPINCLILSYLPCTFGVKYKNHIKHLFFIGSAVYFVIWLNLSSFNLAWDPYKS